MLALIGVNLTRRWTRTLLTAAGVGVGVATIVALLSLTAGLERSAGSLLHLGNAKFGLFQRNVGDLTSSALSESMVARVKEDPGVTDAAGAQLVMDALNGESAFIVFGIEPGGLIERRNVMLSGRRAGRGEIVIGDTATREIGARVGDRLRLKSRTFEVVGTYHTGVTFQDSGGAVPLKDAQALVGRTDEVTTIAVVVKPGVRAKTVSDRLEREFPGISAITEPGEIARADTNSALITKAALVIAVISLLIGAIAVTNTMLMSVLERQRELAVLSAVGWPPRQVAALVLGEGIGVSLLGTALGLALGVAASEAIVQMLAASDFVSPHHTAWGLGRGALIGVAVGVLGGLYPAWRVSRLRPADGLRRE